MNARLVVSAAVALVGIAYLAIQFGRLVLEDRANDHDTAEGPAYDAATVTWLKHLHVPDSEFDAWCEQAIALTREPEHADLQLWERELADGAR